MKINSYTLDDAVQELWQRAQDEGVATQDAWDELVDELVEDHVDLGQIDPDQDTENWKEILKHRWADYRLEQAV